MRNSLISFLFVILLLSGYGQTIKTSDQIRKKSDYVSKVWVADNGDGTYKNPILMADYSDLDVCQAENDYYMTASSFNSVPGLPILHSKDLVNWQIIGFALKELTPKEVFDKPQHAKGVFAPCIRYNKGELMIYWGDPDFGIFMVKTKNPKGDWSVPVLVKEGKGLIDPTPLFDDDGNTYLAHAWAGSRSRINSIITVSKMNPEGTRVVGPEVMVFDGLLGGHHTVEGPKFYKRNGYYYILAPAGGVTKGWQLAMRSRNIYGPYEAKVVMEQGNTDINGPHQGAWVETKTGESWFMHFQDRMAYGRVALLQPVKWIDGWPVMGTDEDGDGKGNPVSKYKKPDVGKTFPVETPVESDEFDRPVLGLQWQWQANPKDLWMMLTNMGFIRLYAVPQPKEFTGFLDLPNLLLQKFPAEEFTASTKLTWTPKSENEKAGLIIMGYDYSYLTISKSGDQFKISQVVCKGANRGNPEKEVAQVQVNQNLIFLKVKVEKNALCSFSYSLNGEAFTAIGEQFAAKQGGWIGAKMGIFSSNSAEKGNLGYADFDWFRVDNIN